MNGSQEINQKVLDYELYDVIQVGTYGQVYKAKNLVTGELCAIKKFYDNGNIYDLRKEYSIISSLEHPNIIKCKRYFEYNDNKELNGYLVLELGKLDLFEYITKHLNMKKIIHYIYDIIKGLEVLHSKNIVHCDIKLENVIIFDDCAKIIDFGGSKIIEKKNRFKKVSIVGTAGLIAPEILNDKICCCKSDIWALGKLIKNIDSQIKIHKPSFSPNLFPIYSNCLDKDYKNRPSALELKQIFEFRYWKILNLSFIKPICTLN